MSYSSLSRRLCVIKVSFCIISFSGGKGILLYYVIFREYMKKNCFLTFINNKTYIKIMFFFNNILPNNTVIYKRQMCVLNLWNKILTFSMVVKWNTSKSLYLLKINTCGTHCLEDFFMLWIFFAHKVSVHRLSIPKQIVFWHSQIINRT